MRMLSRREVLIAGGGALVLAACGGSSTGQREALVSATDPAVEQRDALRRRAGASTVSATVTAAATLVSIGGRMVDTWAFGDRPGAGGIRAKAGDLLELRFVNRLSGANTLHWHGIALRNDMDGVHDLTQHPAEPGGEFVYRFTAPDPGTYWFHPHMGLELDRGLYAPLVIEDPNEPVLADVEFTLMLDDWLDGYGRSAADVLAELQAAGGHGGHDMGGGMGHGGVNTGNGSMAGGSAMMGGLAGDVAYPLHLINGRAPAERETFEARPGEKVRLRLINAGSDTAYRFAVDGHRLTVTHADGFPVEPVEVDNVVLGMGERYDVVVTAGSGAFVVVAAPEGKTDPSGEAVLRTSTTASTPAVGTRPAGLSGQAIRYTDLRATDAVRLAAKDPDRRQTIRLTADMSGYSHGIDGRSFPDSAPITVRQGERLRLRVVNDTMMFHPIHLHGHTFQMVSAGSARKDTVNVESMSAVEFDIEADNPGQWMFHCHNTYHLETGMATTLSYQG
ncbi:MAG: multicopper oxidase family protein [Acidimicrobiales bacterium]|nr:multicopper oxidase family protein [Acidimicrobiales bacterium]